MLRVHDKQTFVLRVAHVHRIDGAGLWRVRNHGQRWRASREARSRQSLRRLRSAYRSAASLRAKLFSALRIVDCTILAVCIANTGCAGIGSAIDSRGSKRAATTRPWDVRR